MISPPVIIQAAQTFFRCSLLTDHERQGAGTLTHGSGVFSSIPLIQMGCKNYDEDFRRNSTQRFPGILKIHGDRIGL